MTELMQRILPTVQKPARYTGGEWGEIKKDLKDVRVRVAFCFPDTYEIGMSNLGNAYPLRRHERDGRRVVRARVRPLGETWSRPCGTTLCLCGRWKARLPSGSST